MAEIINLATFTLDTAKLQSSLDSLQNTYFDLRKEQKAYSDQSKETQKQIDELVKTQKLLSTSAGDNTKAMADNEAKINSLVSTQKELFKSEQNLALQLGTVKKEINLTTTQIRAYQDAEGKTKSLIDLGNEALNRQIKSKNDARAANIALNNVANQLNPSIDEEAKLLVKLNGKMDENTKFIKANSSETAKQKMNVGNYTESINEAFASINPLNGGIAGLTQRSKEAGGVMPLLQNGLKGVTTGVLGLIKASLAFLATPIGAFIGAISAVFLTLFSVFKNFTPLLDKVEQGFAALGSVLDVIKTTIVAVATGTKNLGAIFSGLGGEMRKAAASAIAFTKAQQDLDDALEKQEITSARNRAEIEKLNTLAKDRTKSDAERIALLKRAEELETADYKQRVKNAKEEERITLERIKSAAKLNEVEFQQLKKQGFDYKETAESKGVSADALFTKLKENQIKLASLDQEYNVNLEKGINKQNKLIEDAEAERQKAREKAIEKANSDREKAIERENQAIERALEKSKAEIDLFIANQGFKKKSIQEEYEFNNQLYAKETADLKLQLDKKKISQIQYDAELRKLQNDKLKTDAELTIQNAEIELDAQIEKNNRILNNDRYLSDEQLKIKQEALNNSLIAENEFQKKLLENGVINQQEYDSAIAGIKAESKAKEDELIAQNKASEQEKSLIDLDNKKIVEEENFIAQAELEKQRNAILLAQELEDAERNGADTTLIKDKYAKIQEDIDRRVLEAKLKATADIFGGIAEILGENSKAGKAAAIAQATINTYQGVTSAWMAPAVLPQPFDSISKIVASGVALASGLKAVKQITAVKNPTASKEFKKPSYASGVIGLRGAGSGTSDDITANLSAGESVINARSTSMFANELSAINTAGGGVGLNGASNILNQNEIQTNANNSQLASMIAEAVAMGSEIGTLKGSQKGIIGLSDNRKVMADAKF